MFSLPPRGGKSPPWHRLPCHRGGWGKFPSDKIMSLGLQDRSLAPLLPANPGHHADQGLWLDLPHVKLSKDAHAVGYWNVEEITRQYDAMMRGEYQAGRRHIRHRRPRRSTSASWTIL
jgi:hypothetical protein